MYLCRGNFFLLGGGVISSDCLPVFLNKKSKIVFKNKILKIIYRNILIAMSHISKCLVYRNLLPQISDCSYRPECDDVSRILWTYDVVGCANFMTHW